MPETQLALQLLVAAGMLVGTVLFHLAGLGALLSTLKFHRRIFRQPRTTAKEISMALLAAFGLLALHIIEIGAYAALYLTLRAFDDFETALYFSTASYTTLGFGDVLLDRAWRILGAFEAVNGLILIGWSTAFFLSVISKLAPLRPTWLDEND